MDASMSSFLRSGEILASVIARPYQRSIFWIVPLPSNSHHQDYSVFSSSKWIGCGTVFDWFWLGTFAKTHHLPCHNVIGSVWFESNLVPCLKLWVGSMVASQWLESSRVPVASLRFIEPWYCFPLSNFSFCCRLPIISCSPGKNMRKFPFFRKVFKTAYIFRVLGMVTDMKLRHDFYPGFWTIPVSKQFLIWFWYWLSKLFPFWGLIPVCQCNLVIHCSGFCFQLCSGGIYLWFNFQHALVETSKDICCVCSGIRLSYRSKSNQTQLKKTYL